MKAEALTPGPNVSQALTKGACPICGILKDFQWTLVETTRPQSDLRVCNFHGWALARSRAKTFALDAWGKCHDCLLGNVEAASRGESEQRGMYLVSSCRGRGSHSLA